MFSRSCSLLVSVLALSCFGCSSKPESRQETRHQAEIMSALKLGEGFDTSTGQGIGKTCMEGNGDVKVALFDNPPREEPLLYRSYLSRTVDEATQKALRYLPGDKKLTSQEVSKLELFYGDYHNWDVSSQNDRPDVASFLIYVRSAKEFYERAGSYAHNEVCSGDRDDFRTYEDWKAACGDRYLAANVHGGYVLVTLEVDEMQSWAVEQAADILRLDHANPQTDIIGKLRSLEAQSFHFRFSYALLNGLPRPPKAAFEDFDARLISAENLANYLEALQWGNSQWNIPGFSKDVADGAIDSSVSGGVVEQVFEPYETSFVEFCTDTPEHGQAQGCYADFGGQRIYNERMFREWLAEANSYLAQPSDYCWGFDPPDLKDQWSAYKKRLEQCLSESGLEADAVHCETALDQGGPVVCDYCHISDACQLATITGLEPQTPTLSAYCTQFDPISKNFTESNANQDFKVLSTYVCALHGMGGRFEGTGEEVRVSANQGSGYWYVGVKSDRTKESELVHARVGCVEKSNFSSSQTTSWIAEQNDSASAPSDYDLGVSTNHAVAFNGITGKMEGGGEYARLLIDDVDPGPAEDFGYLLRSRSQQGPLEAYVTSFGLDLPSSASVYFGVRGTYRVSNEDAVGYGESDVALSRVDESFCYLTEVNGDFDGAGEHIDIYPGTQDNRWHAKVKGACEHPNDGTGEWGLCGEDGNIKRIVAEVRCYAYNQD